MTCHRSIAEACVHMFKFIRKWDHWALFSIAQRKIGRIAFAAQAIFFIPNAKVQVEEAVDEGDRN